MGNALASADAATWVSILVKTAAYGATLLAIGSVLVLALLPEVSETGRRALRRTAAVSAIVAALLSLLRVPLRASFLMGGSWGGAWDPVILGMVADSPLGTSVAVRLLGLALILMVLWPRRVGLLFACLGAGLAAVSFALRGHTLGEPQLVLGALITLHILCLAFWVGAFAPLARAARSCPPGQAGALAAAFGHRALWAVGLLVLGGGALLVLLGAGTPAVIATPYGQIFAVKLALFAGVLSLAAINKLSLTPALLASDPGAAKHLRRSVAGEAVLVAGILGVTSALTTLSSPPDPQLSDQASLGTVTAEDPSQTTGDAS